MQRPYAPKQWSLSANETITSYETWRQNLVYTLNQDLNFAEFLTDDASWSKKSTKEPLRGYPLADNATVAQRHIVERKVRNLEMMLGFIANFCPGIHRRSITHTSTCLNDIWQVVRLHYGFLSSGAQFLSFGQIKFRVGQETHEALFQRLASFVEDNLLKTNDLLHHGEKLTEDEDITPTLENFQVYIWLHLLNEDLPALVQQRYGTELRKCTLASIRAEISQALPSLLEELKSSEDVKVFRTNIRRNLTQQTGQRTTEVPQPRYCSYCKAAKRRYDHPLTRCWYLPKEDQRYHARIRQILGDVQDYDEEDPNYTQYEPYPTPESEEPRTQQQDLSDLILRTRRIQIRQSPFLDVFYHDQHVRVTIDSGAEGNLISLAAATRLGAHIHTSSQAVRQADGKSPLPVVGETNLTFSRDTKSLRFHGAVVEKLDVEILGGTVFMEENDVYPRPSRKQVFVGENVYYYGSDRNVDGPQAAITTRRATLVRAPDRKSTVYPGEFIEIKLPVDSEPNAYYALEPRTDSPIAQKLPDDVLWPHPAVIRSIDGKIRIPNNLHEALVLKKQEHFCQVWPTYPFDTPTLEPEICCRSTTPTNSATRASMSTARYHSSEVQLDPDSTLPPDIHRKFTELHIIHDSVFDPNYTGYNGHAGDVKAHVNMGSVPPPQHKGRLPMYNHKNLVALQEKFDDLYGRGVLVRPETVGVAVEYVNPSFLVRKSNGKFRLVTAFTDIGRYSKPQPSRLPDVDSTLRQIGQWKFLIKSDLTSAYYQIPLSHESMKYCGVSAPYRGTFVYARSAMGMPGSETALGEVMDRVLGHMVQEGKVAKIADDFYVGGQSPSELLSNWSQVLEALSSCNLRISAAKTIICPKSMEVLGWVWRNGTLQASLHRVSTLSTCDPPSKVKGLRTYIGAFKVLSRVLPDCAGLVCPLDDACAGRQSSDVLDWSESLTKAFEAAKSSLQTCKSIVLPRTTDRIWIVTDGATRSSGIGATMYVTRNEKLYLAGFYSAKLKGHQSTWLPCEVEALSIAAATKHFSPYITESTHKTCLLTDNKPCVQAYEKLCRGEFSCSPRVYTFLSTASRFQILVQHVSGCSILPSDFASRHAPECDEPQCQICKFVQAAEETVVRAVSLEDVVSGKSRLPFTSRNAWKAIQSECSHVVQAIEYLDNGKRPSKKLTNIRDVKRYLQKATVTADGLLVVKETLPLLGNRERIVVPRKVVDGLMMSLHIRLGHPTSHQLRKVVCRNFFALDLDKVIERTTIGCHQCLAMTQCKQTIQTQSTSDPPEAVGLSFSADVLRRERQIILVIRETITSFTFTKIIDDERSISLRNAVVELLANVSPQNGPMSVVRCDPAPGFVGLTNDSVLQDLRIRLEIGRAKNRNKNPVAERAVQEIEAEIVRAQPEGGPVSTVTLATVTARLNSRIRENGLASREMLFQRDQFTNQQISIPDSLVADEQHQRRLQNHDYSARAKCPKELLPDTPSITVGDIIYIIRDKDKTRARERYLVTSIEGSWCNVRKFAGSQLRQSSYRVKLTDCMKVPSELLPTMTVTHDHDDSLSEYNDDEITQTPLTSDAYDPSAVDISDYLERCVRNQSRTINTQSHLNSDTSQAANDIPPNPEGFPQIAIPPEISEPLTREMNNVATEPMMTDTNCNSLCLQNNIQNQTRVRRKPAWHASYHFPSP